MIPVNFPEPSTEQWRKWKREGQEATEALIRRAAAGETVAGKDIKDALYKGARGYFYEAFNKKCAYCEAKFILDQSGDVDHYRPKGHVTDEFDRPVMRGKVHHPGYYWLAYDWQNLLPSCSKCNRPSRVGSGRVIGKGTRFPVQPASAHAFEPAGIANEVPVFPNPLVDDPSAHLTFDPDTGIIGGMDERGRLTVELLGLNREGLPEERQKIHHFALGIIDDVWDGLQHKDARKVERSIALLNRYLSGMEPYSWPARLAIKESRSRVEPLVRILGSC